MVKFYSDSTQLEYTWNQVAVAFWRRYPNPHSTHVLTEDTISREVRNGVLYTKRLLSKTNPVPKWGERFYTAKSVKIVEESECDPKTKTLVTYTRNIALTKIMSVTEKVVYQMHPDNHSHTAIHRSAMIDSQVFGFSKAIAAFGLERFKKNCAKMIRGFEHVLGGIYPHHATSLALAAQVASAAAGGKTQKIKEAAKHASEQVKAQAEQIYHQTAYSAKN